MKTYATRPEHALDDVASSAPDSDRARRNAPGRRARPAPRLDPLTGRSHAGAALPDAIRAPIEARTGVDLGGVRVHNDAYAAAVARGLGTIAAARGADIYVAGPKVPDAVMAHEAAHAAQARSGAPVGDARTVEADASRIAAGGDGAPAVRAAPGAFARWEGPEHQDIGDAAVGVARIPLPNYPDGLTYGELISLAGDFFDSYEGLLAASEEEIDEILAIMHEQRATYERRIEVGRRRRENPEVTQSAAVDEAYGDRGWGARFDRATGGRYLRLARGAENRRHFSDQGTSYEAYAGYHGQAIEAARQRSPQATVLEGFAAHYLSDAFSSGHVRAEVPVESLERQRQHNYDGERGLSVRNYRGDRWIAYGDGNLNRQATPPSASHPFGGSNEMNRRLAIEAVTVSRGEVMGVLQGATPPVDSHDYAVNRLWPRADRDHPRYEDMPPQTEGDRWGQFGTNVLLEGILPSPIVGAPAGDIVRGALASSVSDRARNVSTHASATRLGRGPRTHVLQHLVDAAGELPEERIAIASFIEQVPVDERLDLVDRVGLERICEALGERGVWSLLTVLAPAFARASNARRLAYIRERLDGRTQEWEELVVFSILEHCGPGDQALLVNLIGEARLRDELGDHPERLAAIL